MANDLAGGAAGTGPLRAAERKHQWQIDILRLLTFLAVICVHSLAFTEVPGNRVAAGLMMVLQFGREVFFAISGFVLVYTTTGKRVSPGSFWRRRLPFVLVPYLTWTLIYYFAAFLDSNTTFSWGRLGDDVIDGGASYHLYFLVVSVQLYLAFPLLVRFVRRTAGHAGVVLAVAAVANLTWLGVLEYVPAPSPSAHWWWAHAYELLPTYTIYIFAGCYAAMNLDRISRVVADHGRRLLAVAAVCAAGALVVYAVQLGWMAPRAANAVLQPAMAATCVAAALSLYVLGSHWAAGARRHAHVVATLSEVSFGVYLAHPLVLDLLLHHGLGSAHQTVPAPLATALGIIGAAGGATVLCLLVRRTPLALALTGRPRVRSHAMRDGPGDLPHPGVLRRPSALRVRFAGSSGCLPARRGVEPRSWRACCAVGNSLLTSLRSAKPADSCEPRSRPGSRPGPPTSSSS